MLVITYKLPKAEELDTIAIALRHSAASVGVHIQAIKGRPPASIGAGECSNSDSGCHGAEAQNSCND